MATSQNETNNHLSQIKIDVQKGYCENYNNNTSHRIHMMKIPYSSMKNYLCYAVPRVLKNKEGSKSNEKLYPDFKFIKFDRDEKTGQLNELEMYDDLCLSFNDVTPQGPFYPYDRMVKGSKGPYNAGPDTAEYNFNVSNDINPDMLKNIHHFKTICKMANTLFNMKYPKNESYNKVFDKLQYFYPQEVTFTQISDDDSENITFDSIYGVNINMETGEMKISTISSILSGYSSDEKKAFTSKLKDMLGNHYSVPSSSGNHSTTHYTFTQKAHKPFNKETKREYFSIEILPSYGNHKRSKIGTSNKSATSDEEFQKMKDYSYWQTTRFFIGRKDPESGEIQTMSVNGITFPWFGHEKRLEEKGSSYRKAWKEICSYKAFKNDYSKMKGGQLHSFEDNKDAGFIGSVNISISSVGTMGTESAKCHFCSKTVNVIPGKVNFGGTNDKTDTAVFDVKLKDLEKYDSDDESSDDEQEEKTFDVKLHDVNLDDETNFEE